MSKCWFDVSDCRYRDHYIENGISISDVKARDKLTACSMENGNLDSHFIREQPLTQIHLYDNSKVLMEIALCLGRKIFFELFGA